MNMKTNKIIERNAELQEHLTKENKKYIKKIIFNSNMVAKIQNIYYNICCVFI